MAIHEDNKIMNVQKLHFYKDLLKTKKCLIITDINEIEQPPRTLTLRTVRSTKIDNLSAIKSEQDLETDEFRCFRSDLFTREGADAVDFRTQTKIKIYSINFKSPSF